ncbi:MAG TPA: HTTM domain-containing protein [Mycobacteriales bacterium]|nr:HTTM domain-containing protein [Mycobacteriales bacterium]
MTAVSRWWFEPVGRGRIAWLRTLLYLFVPVDVLLTTSWVSQHADVPGALYQPLFIGRLLPLPTPTRGLVLGLQAALLVASVVAATGRRPRVLGTVVFLLYFEWMVVAMSYGKVDHDRFAYLVALAVLPTVGRARHGDREPDESVGWAVRCIQVAVVLTYFLAAFAKFRFGGLDWANGATLTRALLRRGTFLGTPLLSVPWLLVLTQWGIIAFELGSPLLLARGRIGRGMVAFSVAFHLVTFATITIIFLPHVMCLLSFLALENLRMPAALRRGTRSGQRDPEPVGVT